MVAAWCCSNFEEIPHTQGQRRSLSKLVEGVKSHLESNPILPETFGGLKQTLCASAPRDPTVTPRTVFECLLWRYASAVDCHRAGALGCSRPGYGISPLGRGHH